MHKCDRCEYKGEHQEMGFRPVGVCLKESNLVRAAIAFGAPKCPFRGRILTFPKKLGKLQSTINQLSKALCGKENSTMDEILKAAYQVKSRLDQAEREKDAVLRCLMKATKEGAVCTGCRHDLGIDGRCEEADFDCKQCKTPCMCKTCKANSNYQWRGVCDDDTEDKE